MSDRRPSQSPVVHMGSVLSLGLLLVSFSMFRTPPAFAKDAPLSDLYVNPTRGKDSGPGAGSSGRPFRSISAAIAAIPEKVQGSVTIHLMPGRYDSTGGHAMPDNHLVLRRQMAPGSYIRLKGEKGKKADRRGVTFDWVGAPMVTVLAGRWRIESVQVGTRNKRQRKGVVAEGAGALLDLVDVQVRTASNSGSGIQAQRAGRVHLYGAIELNEDLHDTCEDVETFCRITAIDHGTVKFMQGKGASLSIGNGGLAASRYGIVRLGCETARIRSWGKSHPIAIGNSGRVDLGGTKTQLSTMHPNGIVIAAEDDGHILAENTRVILQAGPKGNASAITLQKASTLFGGPFEIKGSFRRAIVVMSGSVFVGKVTGDIGFVDAYTGAHISLQAGSALPKRAAEARTGATIVLPDGQVLRERAWRAKE